MAALRHVDRPGYAALILRRNFPQLTQPGMLIPLSKHWLANTDAHWSERDMEWRFPSGAVIKFGHVQDENAVYNYQGGAYQMVGFDELTQFTPTMYEYIAFSRARRDLSMADIPIQIRSTANPGGIGHTWVMKKFIEPGESGVVFVPAKIADNPGIDVDDYTKRLMHLSTTRRAQLLDGDWGVFEGAAFPDFAEEIHCVPAFDPPPDWTRFESLDFGIANPTAVLAWAADYDGNLIVFDSYYSPPNTLISQHAEAIRTKRERWWPKTDKGWYAQSVVCYADHDLWSNARGIVRLGAPASILDEFREHDLEGFIRAHKGRKEGRARLLELIKPIEERRFPAWHPRAGELGAPHLFVVGVRCPELIEQLRTAPTNEQPIGDKTGPGEIVDPQWETRYGHAAAALRYGAMSWQAASEELEDEPSDPRAAALQRIEKAEALEDEEAGLSLN